MTEQAVPPLFDIYETGHFEPAAVAATAGRPVSMVELSKSLDSFIEKGEGEKARPGEILRTVAANQVSSATALFDISSGQQIGIGTLMMRDKLYPDGRPVFDSVVIVGSQYMRNGFASLTLDYMKHYMASYHPNGIWIVSSPQAENKHMKASREAIRQSGAKRRVVPGYTAAGLEIYDQLVTQSAKTIPPSISVNDILFIHRQFGEVRKLTVPSEPTRDDLHTALTDWTQLRKSGFKTRVVLINK